MEKIIDQLRASVAKHPHEVAVNFERGRYRYTTVWRRVEEDAERLSGMGIGEGDVVAINLPNVPEAVYLLYACDYVGAIAYFIHPLTPEEQLSGFLQRSRAKALFTLLPLAKAIAAHCPKVRVVALNPYQDGNLPMRALAYLRYHDVGDAFRLSELPRRKAKMSRKSPSDTSIYLNSGGTNGDPKIIMLSSAAVASLACRGFEIIDIKDERQARMYTVIPLFHGFGLAMGVATPLCAGGQVTLDIKFHPKKCIKRMAKGQASIIIGVPALFNALLSNPGFKGQAVRNLIVCFVGGDSVTKQLLDRFDKAVAKEGGKARLFEGYGLTETVTVSNVNTSFACKDGTVGKPLRGIKEKILDPKTHLELPIGEKGELAIAGPSLMNGYFEDEELTRESFITLDGDRYVLTRDLAYLDEDGFLHFCSRLRRVAKVNGVMVLPSELERVALSCKDVYEAYCFAEEDKKHGQLLSLAVSKNRASNLSEEDIAKRLRAAIEQSLPVYYKPKRIIFLPKLPRTAVGKVDQSKF